MPFYENLQDYSLQITEEKNLLKAKDYLPKKAPSQPFGRVLDTPLRSAREQLFLTVHTLR